MPSPVAESSAFQAIDLVTESADFADSVSPYIRWTLLTRLAMPDKHSGGAHDTARVVGTAAFVSISGQGSNPLRSRVGRKGRTVGEDTLETTRTQIG